MFVGGIGSGKSVSIIKEIVDRSKFSRSFVNFSTKGIRKCERIKMDWIIKEEIKGETKTGKPLKEKKVNYEFWNEQKKKGRFSIYLDEVHNIMHSRLAMTRQNVLMSMWISQIRKVFGDQESDHLYLITQKLKRIDVSLRDLAHWIIECRKITLPSGIAIQQSYYPSEDHYELGIATHKKVFNPKPYFKYYDSYEFIDFGNEVYL